MTKSLRLQKERKSIVDEISADWLAVVGWLEPVTDSLLPFWLF